MQKQINLMCPINNLGYGIASVNILKKLYQKCHVSLSLIGENIQVETQEDANIVSECIQRERHINFDAPCIKIFHQNQMGTFAGKGMRIGFPFFELDEFSPIEKHHLNSLDKLFVASDWAKNVCLNNNLKISEENIHVVPLGVDNDLFVMPTVDLPRESNNTIFFNCGKWEVRKGHDILPEIFNRAFSEEDNVELWMMCDSPFMSIEENEQWRNLYRSTKLGSKIKFIDRVKSHSEVYNIMTQVDCGIFPSRAEGWNLELLEMMSCGKQVIATNYSGHTQFCSDESCALIEIEEKEVAYDGVWFSGNYGKWMKITENNKQAIVDSMLKVHESKQNNGLEINYNGIITANSLSWDNTAQEIIKYV